jgi:hypothetical protein
MENYEEMSFIKIKKFLVLWKILLKWQKDQQSPELEKICDMYQHQALL